MDLFEKQNSRFQKLYYMNFSWCSQMNFPLIWRISLVNYFYLIFQMSLLGIRKIDPLRENDDYQLFTEANANAQSGTAAKTANMVG